MNRDFKGVWIPKEVWLDERLSALDKVILTEIDSLDQGEKGCFASNQYIAEFCQCSATKVSNSVSKLIECGYLYVQKFDGRERQLKSRLTNFVRQDYKNCEAESQKVQESNIVTNKKNKIDNTIYESEFEEIWKKYPKKAGKEMAKKSYIKARREKIEKETIEAGLDRYIECLKAMETEDKYIKNGSTWFNQRCWNDEYKASKGSNNPINEMQRHDWNYDDLQKLAEQQLYK